ncbi:MAG: dual specificity protein phosphatase family protein [Bacteroidales bacterium]|nr:dual specificity protein phosphatase family protein [Bacteroidales bacterium]
MKTYTFAKVSARGYLTKADLSNNWIITDDLGLVLNLSERKDEDAARFLADRDVAYIWFPLTEEAADMGYRAILEAVREMIDYAEKDKRIIVHCDFGNNRSRTVIEAFHFAIMRYHLDDEYKGFQNHLIYNSKSGHLPPMNQIEEDLIRIADDMDDEQVEVNDIWARLHKSAFDAIYDNCISDCDGFINCMIDSHWEEVEDCYCNEQVEGGLADLWETGDYEDPATGICMRYYLWGDFFAHPHSYDVYDALVETRRNLTLAHEEIQESRFKLKKIEETFK